MHFFRKISSIFRNSVEQSSDEIYIRQSVYHYVEILRCWRVADPLIYRRKYRISTNHIFGDPWEKKERERESKGVSTSLVDRALNGLPGIDFR